MTQTEQGDYLVGESAIYEITDRDGDDYRVKVAEPYLDKEDEASANEGWQSEEFVKSLGSVVKQNEVADIEVGDRDTVIWNTGHLTGESEEATVNIEEDGTVELESSGPLVPKRFSARLVLECNIALGFAEQ